MEEQDRLNLPAPPEGLRWKITRPLGGGYTLKLQRRLRRRGVFMTNRWKTVRSEHIEYVAFAIYGERLFKSAAHRLSRDYTARTHPRRIDGVYY